MESIITLRKSIDTRLVQLEVKAQPRNLYEPIGYLLALGGKRFRPLLVLLTAQLRGMQNPKALDPALAVEVFHNFTLMHDDIMDAAPLRRGQPSVHEKWNQNTAILSGDAMFVKAYQLITKIDPSYLLLAMNRFNETALEVCEGQQLDMDFEQIVDVSQADYLEMIRLKTAVLLGFSMELGGIMGGFGREDQERLYKVGENLGLGFQLMDDLLDVYGDQQKVGKQVGGDIIANKKTFLMINALDLAGTDVRSQLNGWISMRDVDSMEKVAGVKNIFNDLGIPQLVKIKMDAYFDEAFRLLKTIDCDKEGLDFFNNFAKSLIKREG
jgi:geranylgeranyl diphosphate synthase type II